MCRSISCICWHGQVFADRGGSRISKGECQAKRGGIKLLFVQIFLKLHENENWAQRGREPRTKFYHVDPPLAHVNLFDR